MHEEDRNDTTTLFGETTLEIPEPVLPDVPDLSQKERFDLERAAVGFLISGHPLESYGEELQACHIAYGSALGADEYVDGDRAVAGVVTSVQSFMSRNNRPYFHVHLSDPLGEQKFVLFESEHRSAKKYLVEGSKVVVDSRHE